MITATRLREIATDADNFYRDEIKDMASELLSLRSDAHTSGEVKVTAAPFKAGDPITLPGVGECVVQQCFYGVGGWRVIAKGPTSRHIQEHQKYRHGVSVFPLFAPQPPTPAGVREITDEPVERMVKAMRDRSHLSLQAQIRAALAAAKGAGE